jgi:hypothetical protein
VERGALAVVEAWQRAVNDGAVGDVETLSADTLVIAAPRGGGLIGASELGGWMARSGFSATPLRWFCGADDTLGIEQAARCLDKESGQETGSATIRTVFGVSGGRVGSLARDGNLELALEAAGLCRSDQVRSRV